MSKNEEFFKINFKHCFEDSIGDVGISDNSFKNSLKYVQKAKNKLIDDIKNKIPYVDILNHTDDLDEMGYYANDFISKFDDVVVFGTGGSSLGAECLHQLSSINTGGKKYPNLHIFTNIDPYCYIGKFKKMNLEKTGFVVISKSGRTLETVMQFMTILPLLKQNVGEQNIKNCVIFITEPKSNPMRDIANQYGIPIIDHDINLGGRYSVFSCVGIFPAMLVGLNAKMIRMGGKIVLDNFCEEDVEINSSSISSAINHYYHKNKIISSQIMLAYSDRLGSLSRWYRQLWAESIGKNGYGSQPVYGMGPVDQHSQLQLWLDGPKDKMFTVLSVENDIQVEKLDNSLTSGFGMEFLGGKTLGNLMDACRISTTESLWENGNPTRTIAINNLDEICLGAIMMNFVLETVLTGYALEIDPFNQPAVEKGKLRAIEYLKSL